MPLIVEELTKAVMETGEARIPASLHDSLIARLDRIAKRQGGRAQGTRQVVHVQFEASRSPSPYDRRLGGIVHDRDGRRRNAGAFGEIVDLQG
jgi:hypothetical protein